MPVPGRPEETRVVVSMQAKAVWENVPAKQELSERATHVWRVDTNLHMIDAARHWEVLSPDERTRARRFHRTEHQTRYAVARGILRELTGRYLHREPESLNFVYGAQGKPALPLEYNNMDLRFNVSHCENVVLFAFALGREVGVDVERIRPNVDALSIASRWFSTREASTLRALPASALQVAFIKTWARKESYLKANGVGLTGSMCAFDTPTCAEDIRGVIANVAAAPHETTWSFEDLPVGPGWVAAIVCEGEDWCPVLRHWTGMPNSPE